MMTRDEGEGAKDRSAWRRLVSNINLTSKWGKFRKNQSKDIRRMKGMNNLIESCIF